MNTQPMKRAVIVGATSGMGREVARLLALDGWKIGVAGRRMPFLEELQREFPGQVEAAAIDVNAPEAPQLLAKLIERLGGMDLYFHSSGTGFYNLELDVDKEMAAAHTNAVGFMQMVATAFNHLARQEHGGHIAAITSIAGTGPLGAAPAYSATKRLQNHYITALEQQARMRRLPVTFTDIRPGFVDTPLIAGHRFPMMLQTEAVARSIVRALYGRRRIVTIDWRYRLLVSLWWLVPRWLWVRLPVK